MSTNRLDNEIEMFLKAQESWKSDSSGTGRLEVRCPLPLKDKLDAAKLQGRLDRTSELKFEPSEVDYLATTKLFEEPFLQVLRDHILPMTRVMSRGEDVMVRVDGAIWELPMWEVPISNQIHDLYFSGIRADNGLSDDMLVVEGIRRLQHKADMLRMSGLVFTEAGTRWRYTWDWYEMITSVMIGDFPNLIEGTTNPWTAMKNGLGVISRREEDKWLRVELPTADVLARVREETDQPIVVTGVNAFEMAHLSSHVPEVSFEWGADLTADMGPGGIPLPLTFRTIS